MSTLDGIRSFLKIFFTLPPNLKTVLGELEGEEGGGGWEEEEGEGRRRVRGGGG